MNLKPGQTIRRDVLLRRAKEGRLEAKCIFSMTDDYAFDAAYNCMKMDEFKPVHIQEPVPVILGGVHQLNQWDEPRYEMSRKDGHVNLNEDCFQFKSGRAYVGSQEAAEKGIINLSVHSNLLYEVRIKGGN